MPRLLVWVTTISATALKGTAVTTSTLTLVKGALKVMAWTKAKTAIVTGVVLILAAGHTTVVVKLRATKCRAIRRHSEFACRRRPIQTGFHPADGRWQKLGARIFHVRQRPQRPFPKTFAEVKDGGYVKKLSDANWEVVSSGDQKSFADPAKTVLLREKEPRPSPMALTSSKPMPLPMATRSS